jgi:hypothetical protein
MFVVIYIEMTVGFVAEAFDLYGLFFFQRFGLHARVIEFPWRFVGSRVVLDVLNIPASFEEKGLESFFGKLHRGPTAGDAGADYYCFVSIHFLEFEAAGGRR